MRLGGNPDEINPLAPAELVIDHSVQVDRYGTPHCARATTTASSSSATASATRSCAGASRRFAISRWCRPTPASCTRSTSSTSAAWCSTRPSGDTRQAYPDTLVGTDSHTTMINGLGVLGWGVGGIEAEAAMLGQPVTMLIPQVVGFRLSGSLPPGATATDLVLTVTEMLRKQGVVDKFVEFFGDGLANLPLADRATIGNMSPEFGSTCAIFPIDEETLRYLTLSGRPAEQIQLVEDYARAQGLWRINGAAPAQYTDVLELDLGTVEPSLAGPSRPQDRVPLRIAKSDLPRSTCAHGRGARAQAARPPPARAPVSLDGKSFELRDGAVLIAAITSCTNTSNPVRADGRRTAGAQCAPPRPHGQALGQDQPGAGLARGHRLPAEGRAARRAGAHRLRPGRLRLHHLHRQLRPAQARDLRRPSRPATSSAARCCRATATSTAACTRK